MNFNSVWWLQLLSTLCGNRSNMWAQLKGACMSNSRHFAVSTILVAMLSLSACSSSPDALDKSANAVRQEKTYADNYQEVYRRLANTARRCMSATGSYTSFQVDADIYSELGYAELAYSLQSLGSRNYYWKAKIEKSGTGSKIGVISGNTLAQGRTLRDVIRWADGDPKC
ncbi:hypothetical protein [Agrobacterium vitis]|nr:hypothetical protein [Agrobacterium vitis]NSX96159.1 hypothetical protein [Agrobacterium vitis]NSZ27298.1 hypothetical protein [Agrobacterium vitis]